MMHLLRPPHIGIFLRSFCLHSHRYVRESEGRAGQCLRASLAAVALAAAACFAGTGVASAQDGVAGVQENLEQGGRDLAQQHWADRYSVAVGIYKVRPETAVRLDSGRVGTTLSLERDLGLNSDVVVRDLSLGIRLGRRHRLELERFGIDRDGTRTATRTIFFGDDTYEAGLQLDTELDTDVMRLGYAYSFVRDARKEIGVQVGVHVTDISMRMAVRIQPITSDTQESAETTAPLPVFGMQGAYRFLPRWTMSGRAQMLRLTVGDYDGEINHVALAFEHATSRRIGIGVALDFFELDVDSQDESFLGSFRMRFDGPRLFLHGHF